MSISCIIINFILLLLMLSEGGEENSIKRAGTERFTSSIIKSGQKDTEASINPLPRLGGSSASLQM